jgi:phosphosulfolactate phosphohydrolase-like enzyme
VVLGEVIPLAEVEPLERVAVIMEPLVATTHLVVAMEAEAEAVFLVVPTQEELAEMEDYQAEVAEGAAHKAL